MPKSRETTRGDRAQGWSVRREGLRLTLARRLPVRWDVAVVVPFPSARRLRVAHQVRQDVWRALRGQRGFAPAVEVVRTDTGLLVRAGGQVDGVHDKARLEAMIGDVLESPANRARWLRSARIRAHSDMTSRAALPAAGRPSVEAGEAAPCAL